MSSTPQVDFIIRTTPPNVDFDISVLPPNVDFDICNPLTVAPSGLFLPVTLEDGNVGYLPVDGSNQVAITLANGQSAYLQTDGVSLPITLADNTAAFINLVTL